MRPSAGARIVMGFLLVNHGAFVHSCNLRSHAARSKVSVLFRSSAVCHLSSQWNRTEWNGNQVAPSPAADKSEVDTQAVEGTAHSEVESGGSSSAVVAGTRGRRRRKRTKRRNEPHLCCCVAVGDEPGAVVYVAS